MEPEQMSIKPKEPEQPKCHTLLEYLLFKIDRTIAILGLIAIGLFSIFSTDISETSAKMIGSVITGLSMYLGVRLGSK